MLWHVLSLYDRAGDRSNTRIWNLSAPFVHLRAHDGARPSSLLLHAWISTQPSTSWTFSEVHIPLQQRFFLSLDLSLFSHPHASHLVLVARNSPGTYFPPVSTPAFRSTPWGDRPSIKKSVSNRHPFSVSNHFLIHFFVFSLENAVVKALETHFSRQLDTSNNPRDRFYDKFQRAADDHDRDFAKKCGGDLNTTLIFVGLFCLSYPLLL